MAIFEYSGTLKYKDKAGNLHIMKPRTTSGNVEGLTQLLDEKENSGAAATALENAKAYTDQKIEGIPTPDVSVQIKAHNESQDAHPYIRGLIPTKTSQLENDSGYLTQHQDISGKLDKPTNDATATAGQLLTKTANGQEWQDREEDIFVVNMITNDGSTIASSDKTFDEVQTACNAGKCVIVRLDTTSEGIVEYLPLVVFHEQSAVFLMVNRFAIWTSLLYITMSPDDSIQLGSEDIGSLAFKSTVAKSDLASDVQTSLDKANSALQSAPNTSSLIKGNGSGGLVAATRGSDYIASGNIVKQTLVATETTPTENYAINWVYG